MNTTNTGRDFAQEYFDARVVSRSTHDLTVRDAAWKAAAKVVRDADRAGVHLDEIAIDEEARIFVINNRYLETEDEDGL